ncbi:hypothetical protein COCCADRAFT_98312 [Bipolaris zeicola 26-R-13]|uniref:2EXR domain-containing protein n=1 Tax=Cochliobolus carbonum (strain 26-R-13) TaxID=930089 RepID=W6Y3P7_COCC2|nr:uncharacterized protein COCCADRAFT_98312 [Bipolaris zeicola 26-R-13]EUC32603.1 hypothetical protein COCCADRAFT_98312 [Bipolaris zeicola 26-R-13]
MPSFTLFPKLPKELREQIWLKSLPTTSTVEFNEAEFDVTSISPPLPHLLTSKEMQATALSSLSPTPYPIWGPSDWETLLLDGEKMTSQVIIHASKSASLTITWTDVWSVLGDALLAARSLHFVCREPERLARLFMLEEKEWLGVGQACNERGLFMNEESVAGERATREALWKGVTVTASKHTVEEVEAGLGRGEVHVWKLGEERFSRGFGEKSEVVTTRGFERVEVEGAEGASVAQLHHAAKAFEPRGGMELEEGEEEEAMPRSVELTEDAIARHLEECERIWPPEPKDPGMEEGSISYPDNAAVEKWLG